MSSVHVTNISPETTPESLKSFFDFCGKVTDLNIKDAPDGTKTAKVVFEKESARKTALLLHKTQLGSSEIHVDAAEDTGAASTESAAAKHEDDSNELDQEDKPRTRILAEYLAHGYKLGDHAIQQGIDLDAKYGVSKRFTSFLEGVDKKTGATTRAAAVDKQYNISDKATKGAQSAWLGLSSYYEKFTETSAGGKLHGQLHSFYVNTNKQVNDIHQEALRLAGLKKNQSGEYPPHTVGFNEKGEPKTQCSCQSDAGVCGCKIGACNCSGCSKANEASSGEKSATGQHTATGAADQVAGNTGLDPLASQK